MVLNARLDRESILAGQNGFGDWVGALRVFFSTVHPHCKTCEVARHRRQGGRRKTQARMAAIGAKRREADGGLSRTRRRPSEDGRSLRLSGGKNPHSGIEDARRQAESCVLYGVGGVFPVAICGTLRSVYSFDCGCAFAGGGRGDIDVRL